MRGRVFGEVAGAYEDARAGYPEELVDEVLSYAGVPGWAVEVGAGTGKATGSFVARGLSLTCVEPDARMAAVLASRYPGVTVHAGPFEDWTPPAGGVPLVYSAQAWHWVDAATRYGLLHDALAPGGAAALFWNGYVFADQETADATNGVYAVHAPELMEPPPSPDGSDFVYAAEVRDSGLFTDVRTTVFHSLVAYPTARYRALLGTFSGHRMLPDERRDALHDALAAVIDRLGGVVSIDLATALVLARRGA